MPMARSMPWRVVASAAILLGLAGVATTAGAAEETPSPKCRKAEINPVTGHVLCIDPLGAPVEAPPEEAKPRCKPEDARGQWSYGPACAPELGGS
jgi:hypothetical protein